MTLLRALAASLAISFAASLAAVGCFSPDEPPCSFACGPLLECPDDYKCMSDRYCHLHGQIGSCGFPDGGAHDLAAPQPDLPSTQDLSGSSIDM